jgi:hypothetical protein
MRWCQPRSARVLARRVRIPSNVKFLNETQLEDGSYLSFINPQANSEKKDLSPSKSE